jgi:hypothetical protein
MIGLQGADQLQARLNALKDSPRGILRSWQIATVAEAKLAVPRKTGTLGRSIRAGTLFSDHAVVEAAVNYAAFVEYGTRAAHRSGRATSASSCASPANGGSARLTGSVRRGGDRRSSPARSTTQAPGRGPFLVPGARAALDEGRRPDGAR